MGCKCLFQVNLSFYFLNNVFCRPVLNFNVVKSVSLFFLMNSAILCIKKFFLLLCSERYSGKEEFLIRKRFSYFKSRRFKDVKTE